MPSAGAKAWPATRWRWWSSRDAGPLVPTAPPGHVVQGVQVLQGQVDAQAQVVQECDGAPSRQPRSAAADKAIAKRAEAHAAASVRKADRPGASRRRGTGGGRGPRPDGGPVRSAPKGLGGDQVEGRHAVRELLLADTRRVREVWVARDQDEAEVLDDIAELAMSVGVPVREVSRAKLAAEARTEAPQGVLAHAAPLPEADLDQLAAVRKGRPAPFLLLVDGVTDPGNLGALLRSAECAGVSGVVLPRHRAVHVTPTVTKAAAGAVEHLPMALVGGLPTAIRHLQDRGVWVVGLDSAGSRSLFDLDLADQPVALVLGAEGKGLSPARARAVRHRGQHPAPGPAQLLERGGRGGAGLLRGGPSEAQVIGPRRLATGLLAAAVVALAAAGCSSGGTSAQGVPSTLGPQSTLPEMRGYTCPDPTGDLGTKLTGTGTGTEPAGIDITTASAQVEGDELVVTFTMAGPVASVPGPFFDVLQGDVSAPQVTWELRAEPTSSGAWGIQLVTFKNGEARQDLSAPVTISGNTLSYRVPLSDIPPIATLQWSFGTSSTASNNSVVFDDCSSITDPSTTPTAPIVQVPGG